MFRLIKLAMYALVGYVLYELYQGMTQQDHSRGSRSFDNEGSSYGAFTGGGEGMIDTASDASGVEMPTRVGRGVIRSGATL